MAFKFSLFQWLGVRLRCLSMVEAGVLACAFGTLAAASAPVNAETTATITVSALDEALAPYGYWVEDPAYGRVWRPSSVSTDWRPYAYGRWVYTSDYGWVWVSDEGWGWVAYHYGRWAWSTRYGWVWVPGNEWGPAWVEWCYGGGYVGWSPTPGDGYWRDGYYYSSFDCADPRYYSRTVYVSERQFAGPSVSAYVVAPSQNVAIAARTTKVTSYRRSKGRIVNSSIDTAMLQAATGLAVRPTKVISSASVVPPKEAIRSGSELRLFQPAIALRGGFDSRLKLEPDKSLNSLGGSLSVGGHVDAYTSPREKPEATMPSLGGSGSYSAGGGFGMPSGGSIGGGLGGGFGGLGRR